MTPQAARFFRQGQKDVQEALAQSQFFECTALYDMAREMVKADLDAGCVVYSDFAQLPATSTVLEFRAGAGRIMILAGMAMPEKGKLEHLQYMVFGEHNGEVRMFFESGFAPGTGENCPAAWDQEILLAYSSLSRMKPEAFASQQATGVNGLIEKMLCMINQPGLVDRKERDTDKRVVRAASSSTQVPLKWHECRIRPGFHGNNANDGNGREHRLHYVRKYFKPSSEKWVEGYWRGNADLGIHLKWYSPQPPSKGAIS